MQTMSRCWLSCSGGVEVVCRLCSGLVVVGTHYAQVRFRSCSDYVQVWVWLPRKSLHVSDFFHVPSFLLASLPPEFSRLDDPVGSADYHLVAEVADT